MAKHRRCRLAVCRRSCSEHVDGSLESLIEAHQGSAIHSQSLFSVLFRGGSGLWVWAERTCYGSSSVRLSWKLETKPAICILASSVIVMVVVVVGCGIAGVFGAHVRRSVQSTLRASLCCIVSPVEGLDVVLYSGRDFMSGDGSLGWCGCSLEGYLSLGGLWMPLFSRILSMRCARSVFLPHEESVLFPGVKGGLLVWGGPMHWQYNTKAFQEHYSTLQAQNYAFDDGYEPMDPGGDYYPVSDLYYPQPRAGAATAPRGAAGKGAVEDAYF